MGFFTKRPSVPASVLNQLGAYGQACWAARVNSQSVSDPQFGWQPFFSKVQPALRDNPSQTIAAIHRAASHDTWARFGGYQLIAELDPTCQDLLYFEMMDAGLELMHERGLSSGHLTRYEADRWIATHGDLRTSFDRSVDTAPPPPEHKANVELAPGNALMVATMGPGALDNQFWIEQTAAGTYGAFSMRRWGSDDDTLTRCAEDQVGQWGTVEELLRSLGSYLRTSPYWAHEQLQPYFTEHRDA